MTESLQMVGFHRLEAALRAGLAGEVRFDRGARAAYSADASNYRQVPIGVLMPKSGADLEARARAVARSTDDYVHQNPWTAIAVAAGIGFIAGMLSRRS